MRAHRITTRARRTPSSGRKPNKKAQFSRSRSEGHLQHEPHLHESGLEASVSSRAKLKLCRGKVHVGQAGSAGTAQSHQCEPGRPPTESGRLAKGRTSRWECRGSAEARPHTEHGSRLLNDHTNWLRPAQPEPKTAPTSTTTFLLKSCSREQEKRPVAAKFWTNRGGNSGTTKACCG